MRTWNLKSNAVVLEKVISINEEFKRQKEEHGKLLGMLLNSEKNMAKMKKEIWNAIYNAFPEIEDTEAILNMENMSIEEKKCSECHGDSGFLDFLRGLTGM